MSFDNISNPESLTNETAPAEQPAEAPGTQPEPVQPMQETATAKQEAPAEKLGQIAKEWEAWASSWIGQATPTLPLPGLSIAQTKCFYRLRQGAATSPSHIDVSINADGDMFGRESNGEMRDWGSIHDERNVFNKIASWYDPHPNRREQYVAIMSEIFPRSTKLGFLFPRKGGK